MNTLEVMKHGAKQSVCLSAFHTESRNGAGAEA